MKEKGKNTPIILLGVIGGLILISILWNSRNANLLEGKTETTVAVVTKIVDGSGVRQVSCVKFDYQIDNKMYSGSDNGNFNFMEIGDTLLIKYSVEDKAVSCVVNKYYMKKYKYLKDK